MSQTRSIQDEWLWGWDPTPGIVSVWAEGDGRAFVWRRDPVSLKLILEESRFRPWALVDSIDEIDGIVPETDSARPASSAMTWRELDGTGELRFLVSANDFQTLSARIVRAASKRLSRPIRHLRDLGKQRILALAPDEQYLVATGRNYFRELSFDQLSRLQFDLETTGLDPSRDRIFMIALRDPDGAVDTLEVKSLDDAGEAELITNLMQRIDVFDPDVIENHNLHQFDLPFLSERARILKMNLCFGRIDGYGLRSRAAWRGMSVGTGDAKRRIRFIAPGRELIDTLDAVLRHGFATGGLVDHGLKAVARHFGISGPEREQIPGERIYQVYCSDPERVRRYARSDVEEVAALARMMSGAAFALSRMAPRRYERLADAGAATGVLDPLLVRAYLRSDAALPAHQSGDSTPHSGAALHLFASGVAYRVVKADVASLYPSLMRAHRIGPARDSLGAMLSIVDRLVEQRLDAKARGRSAPAGSSERHTFEALSAALKLVVNTAYGYLAAGGDLVRFADVHAANEVTRHGREVLRLMCSELAKRGVTLLEADTDGVYFAVPEDWSEADERRVVAEVGELLPPLVQLEFEGRYAAMLSHEPKNYALLGYDGVLILRGVAFRSSRAEPFGDRFLKTALKCLLAGDVLGVHSIYVETISAIRNRQLSTFDMSSRVRLTKSPSRYLAVRESRHEMPYEAMMKCGHTEWEVGKRVRVYRTEGGGARVAESIDQGEDSAQDQRDYDVEHYIRQLRSMYASRLARAFAQHDFAALFADPLQPALFAADPSSIKSVLTKIE